MYQWPSQGLHYMNVLYQELHVPLDAMIVGLENIKYASLQRLESQSRRESLGYIASKTDDG